MLGAGLAWREVAILRAYAKYLRQAGIAFSQDYMERVLSPYPAIAAAADRSLPGALRSGAGRGGVRRPQQKLEPIDAEITGALEGVATLDEDRILRRFLNAVRCTPAHQLLATTGKDWISFKIDSRAIDELPAPRPLVEIFVYSPRMEGIHLRGGRVARGGIRWSDRREDFRTEILGPDEDADGEERRDRAGGLQGRLLRQAPAASAARASRSRPRASPATRR